uniref:Portal protein n=1 Tax=Gokushovirinae environmental samples TaxID=1478972 RepID=A0A2R3UAD0_9VIRU|nr:portal protein [Gokushovirinae environmental samples]
MSYAFFLANGRGKMYSSMLPESRRVAIDAEIGGPSMTRQEFSEECDVNAIVARFEKVGVWPMQPNGVEPVYYDFVDMPDLQGALTHMIAAEEAFMKLPAVVRKEFDNDAMRFVEFAQSRDNVPKLREWGLAEPEKAPDEPMRVRVVPEPDAPPIAPAVKA